MSPESLFRRHPDYVVLRLALEDWTELPAPGTREWEALVYLLRTSSRFDGCQVSEIRRSGGDLFLRLGLGPGATVQRVVDGLRCLLRDPSWSPFFDPERFAWVGGYHVVSLRIGDKIDALPLEHPARTWKREHFERALKRTFPHPWHEAPTPEAVGLEFVAGAFWSEGRGRLHLFYREPEEDPEEARAAAHLNLRVRLPGTRPWLESAGWDCLRPYPSLVFDVPDGLCAAPDQVEIAWETDARTPAGTVPCYASFADLPWVDVQVVRRPEKPFDRRPTTDA